jgi:hypothetical protein
MDDVDEQPGLGAQVWREMRGQPATEMTPAIEAQIAESLRRRTRMRRAD